MPPTYYQIELSARWLTVLLVILAALLVVAFVFGYGAAWSVLSVEHGGAGPAAAVEPTPTPTPEVETVAVATAGAVAVSREQPTRVVDPGRERPTKSATRPPATATAAPTRLPTVRPTAGEASFWVQVLAVENRAAIDAARETLVGIGFPRDHHRVAEEPSPGGGRLYKLRVGPLPDRASADRVAQRMRTAGFTGAWVVAP
jgi:cell division septation protein DedD